MAHLAGVWLVLRGRPRAQPGVGVAVPVAAVRNAGRGGEVRSSAPEQIALPDAHQTSMLHHPLSGRNRIVLTEVEPFAFKAQRAEGVM